jgi:hypothetical protein
MKERTCNCCTVLEDNIAWLFGFVEGCIIGCIFACSEYDNDNDKTNMLNEMMRGAKSGFGEGEWLGHLDK